MSLCHYAFDDFSSFVLGLFFFRFSFFLPVWICVDAAVWKTHRWEGVFMVTLDESLLQQLSICVPAPSETLWYAESVPSNRIRSAWTAQSNYITSESFLVLQYLLRISHTVGTAPARPIKTRVIYQSTSHALRVLFGGFFFHIWNLYHGKPLTSSVVLYTWVQVFPILWYIKWIHWNKTWKSISVLFLFFKVCTY